MSCSHSLVTSTGCAYCGHKIAAGGDLLPAPAAPTAPAESTCREEVGVIFDAVTSAGVAIVAAPTPAAVPHGLTAGTHFGRQANTGAATPSQPSLFDGATVPSHEPAGGLVMQYGAPAGSGLENPAPSRQGREAGHGTAPAARSTDSHRRARNTDPDTSLAAAKTITPDRQRAAHTLILKLLATHGPLSDFRLAFLMGSKQTSAGVRRGELRDAGLVEAHDRAGVSDTGSPCIRWALTATGREAAHQEAAA